MNILAMMQRIQEYLGVCPSCGVISNGKPTECFELCELKAAIDALKSGRLVVVEKTVNNTRRVIRAMRLEKERKEKEHGE